ncbi:MAG: hypothetical protein BWY77_01325 [bacterium ADurb.Bin431]|nr:MAG: hypothetical protein BWY77_01325 [bacterium ADurb.Bin431]
MRPPEVLRPRLPLAVGLDQEAAEIGHPAVDFGHPLPPPRHHPPVEPVGGGELPQLRGGGELDGEVDAHPPGAEHVGDRLHPLEVGVREDLRGRVHVVDHRAVDPDRGVGPGVFDVARIEAVGQLLPIPERAARIAAFDGAVEVIPVVEESHPDPGPAFNLQAGDLLPRLQKAKEMKDAIEYAVVVAGGDGGDPFSPVKGADDQIAFLAKAGELLLQPEGGDHLAGCRRAGHDRAMASGGTRLRDGPAQEPAQAALQLTGGSPQHGRVALDEPAGEIFLTGG